MSERMEGSEWRYRRMECLIRDDYTCQDCGDTGGLEGDAILHAHHQTRVSGGGSDELDNLTTLCKSCHNKKHSNGSSGELTCGRALTTEAEREYIRGEQGDQRMYEARSRVKSRIENRLAEDIDLFSDEAPQLLAALRDVACPGEEPAATTQTQESEDPGSSINVEELRSGLEAARTALEGEYPSTGSAQNEIERALEALDDD